MTKKKTWVECPKCLKMIHRKGIPIHNSRWCPYKTVMKSSCIIGARVPYSVMKWYEKEASERDINISELLRIIPTLIKKSGLNV